MRLISGSYSHQTYGLIPIMIFQVINRKFQNRYENSISAIGDKKYESPLERSLCRIGIPPVPASLRFTICNQKYRFHLQSVSFITTIHRKRTEQPDSEHGWKIIAKQLSMTWEGDLSVPPSGHICIKKVPYNHCGHREHWHKDYGYTNYTLNVFLLIWHIAFLS